MKIGSLFSGIGGLDLALESHGGRIVWQCEIDPHARAVLAERWPGVRIYDDVRNIDEHTPRTDVLVGGFPCQDISSAANPAGRAYLSGARSGLWRWMARAIRLVRPRFAFVENVGHLRAGGMGEVLGDLAEIGLDAEWDCVSACEAGAPHTRERVFILSHAHGDGEPALTVDAEVAGVQEVAGPGGDWRTPPARTLGVADGLPGELDRLRLLGNAVVPQQAALAFRALIARIAQAVTP